MDPIYKDILKISSGLFWTMVYLLIIRKSAKEKTYGMPFIALCANLSWEFIFSTMHPHSPLQHGINICWLVFDLIIFVQFLKWGKEDFPWLSKSGFVSMIVLGMTTAFLLVLFTTYQFEQPHLTGAYAAFGQNLMMSILFISFYLKRKSKKGQSWQIALCKLIGTLSASLVFLLYADKYHQPVMYVLYAGILVFDLIYLLLMLDNKMMRSLIRAE